MILRAFLFFFLLQTLALTLWFVRFVVFFGSRQFWVYVLLLAAIAFAWPIYQRYRSQDKITFTAMISCFFVALAGIIMANVLWFVSQFLSVASGDKSILWSKIFADRAIILIPQISILTLSYWLSMLLFSWIIVGGLRYLRQARHGGAHSIES